MVAIGFVFYGDRRESYTFIALWSAEGSASSVLLGIPFRFCDFLNCHSLFGRCWHRLVFADFLTPLSIVCGRMRSSGDLYPCLVESQTISSYGRWLQLSPFL